jgi:hypothetical protein|tara:strand:- start:600 stop:836 length:237 start_codon:yes stop_codon:yes gene_type:complete
MPTNNLTYVMSVVEGLEIKGDMVARTALVACALEVQDLRKYIVRLLDAKMTEQELPHALKEALEVIRQDERRDQYLRH